MNHLAYLEFYFTLAMFGFGFVMLFILIIARHVLIREAKKKLRTLRYITTWKNRRTYDNDEVTVFDETMSRRRDIR